MKRFKHPEHGFHTPLTPEELKIMKANGWVEDDGAELKAKLAALGLAAEDEKTPRKARG